MSRRSKTINNKNIKRSMRDVTNITRPRLQATYNKISDNRLFSPLPLAFRPIQSTIYKAPLTIQRTPNFKRWGSHAEMHVPKHALICARRKIRKEVLFAKNKSGRGNKTPRFNENSLIHCK